MKKLVHITSSSCVFAHEHSNTCITRRHGKIFTSGCAVAIYKIEHAIKAYRRLSQQNIDAARLDITVDQGLVLMLLHGEEELSQVDIGRLIFKDNASITRILKLMVNKGYIIKKQDPKDKRRSNWHITESGVDTIIKLKPIIESNRQAALSGLDTTAIEQLNQSLKQITQNCQKSSD